MHSNKLCNIRYALLLVISLILSACGNSEDADKLKEALELNKLDISSLQVSSPNTIVEYDATEQFTALAVIGDGSGPMLNVSDKVRWSVSDSDAASITQTGLLTGKADGLVTVQVELADLYASKELQLSSATLTSITITDNPSPISICKTGYALSAQGLYSDATTRDITDLVSWTSADSTTLAFDADGLISTYKSGTVSVSASRSDISSSANITVNDDIASIAISATGSSVYIGKTLPLKAVGTYDNSSTATITNMVNWLSSDTNILTVSNAASSKGEAKGVAAGFSNLTASCQTTTSNSITVSVSEEPVINDVAIEEDQTLIEFKLVDSPEQLTAKLKRSDNTYSTDVSDSEYTTWSISETIEGKAVTLSKTGEISFTQVGTTEIKVRYYDDDKEIGPFTDTIEVKIVAN